jgi:hypothetical protein
MIVKISKMNRLMIALLMGLILGLQAGAFAQDRVVINEFSIGSSYKNGQDFIELKNVGIADANIGNFTIVLENEIIRIPSNTILLAGGFYVASTTKMIATEANSITISLNDSTAKLVDGISGRAANLINASVESILNAQEKEVFSREKPMEIASGK